MPKGQIGGHYVLDEGTEYFVDLIESFLISLPSWVKELGTRFSVLAHFPPSDNNAKPGKLYELGTASGHVENFEREKLVYMVAGPRLEDVLDLYKKLRGMETVTISAAETNSRRACGLRYRPKLARARLHV